MAQRWVVHVGTPKSGTTYLQSALWADRESLLAAGVLVPGAKRHSHTRLRAEVTAGPDEGPTTTRLLARGARHDGTVLLSDEWLVRADRDAVRRLVEACGPAPVDLVVTTRTLTRVVPAAWQEELKLGRGGDLDTFVAELDRPRAKWSWRHLDPVEVLRAWEGVVPADRVHVVVAPGSGAAPGLLWQRFAAAVGIPPEVEPGPVDANETLGVVASRLLQEVGPDLRGSVVRDGDDWQVPYRWLRRYVGHDVLHGVPGGAIALTQRDHAAVRRRAEATAAAIAASGWQVHGDPADLVGPADPVGRHPADVTTAELMAATGQAMGRLLADVRAATGDDA